MTGLNRQMHSIGWEDCACGHFVVVAVVVVVVVVNMLCKNNNHILKITYYPARWAATSYLRRRGMGVRREWSKHTKGWKQAKGTAKQTKKKPLDITGPTFRVDRLFKQQRDGQLFYRQMVKEMESPNAWLDQFLAIGALTSYFTEHSDWLYIQ